jgi:hypothetical protein
LKGILLGKPQVELAELPALIKLHFPKEPKWCVWAQIERYICCIAIGKNTYPSSRWISFVSFFSPLDSSTTLV